MYIETILNLHITLLAKEEGEKDEEKKDEEKEKEEKEKR